MLASTNRPAKLAALLVTFLELLVTALALMPNPLRDLHLFYGLPVLRLFGGGYQGRMDRCLDRLDASRPLDVPGDVWEEASTWTRNACGNICFSPSHVSVEAMKEFVEAFEAALNSEPVNVATLHWVWNYLERIEPSSTHNNEYVKKFKPRFLEALEADGRDSDSKRLETGDL